MLSAYEFLKRKHMKLYDLLFFLLPEEVQHFDETSGANRTPVEPHVKFLRVFKM